MCLGEVRLSDHLKGASIFSYCSFNCAFLPLVLDIVEKENDRNIKGFFFLLIS